MGVKTKLGMAASLAAAAAGAYYLYYSKSAKGNRAKAKAWMAEAEAEIMEKARELKNAALDEQTYKNIVKHVAEKYKMARKLTTNDVGDFVSVLGSAWKKVQKDMKAKAAKISRRADE